MGEALGLRAGVVVRGEPWGMGVALRYQGSVEVRGRALWYQGKRCGMRVLVGVPRGGHCGMGGLVGVPGGESCGMGGALWYRGERCSMGGLLGVPGGALGSVAVRGEYCGTGIHVHVFNKV